MIGSLCSTLYSTFVDKYIKYSFRIFFTLNASNMLRLIRCEGCGISPAFSGCLAHREVKWTDQSADLFRYLWFFGGVWLGKVECSSQQWAALDRPGCTASPLQLLAYQLPAFLPSWLKNRAVRGHSSSLWPFSGLAHIPSPFFTLAWIDLV
jgi:hypothetical protein